MLRQAIAYWELSARGDEDAKTQLGMCYYYGKGVAQDYQKAFYYFHIANVSASGCYMRGICYKNGHGTTKNMKMAISCYREAATKGYKNAQEALERLKGSGMLGIGMSFW